MRDIWRLAAKAILLLMVILLGKPSANAQQDTIITSTEFQPVWSLKNNLLYDATLTPNIGAEVRTGSRTSLQAFYGLNPWRFSDTKRLRHWSLMPEFRYWLSGETFRGWFTGIHALGGEFNEAGIKLPFGLFKDLEHHHYEGWYAGGGLTIGHAWRLADHWRLEAALGLGFIHFDYDKYVNEVCGPLLESGPYNYVGPTKLALNLAYVIGRKKTIIREVQVIPEISEVPAPYEPTYALAYITPQAEPEKSRSLSGKAFLDFVVNKTDIRRDYRRNASELAKVEETIDVVRKDPNTTITHISIHGYASPEGGYASNARLAEGRAKAFKDYVRRLIDLPDALFSVASTPEDWQGLIDYLAHQGDQAAILAIAKSDLAPDEKERQLKQKYPQQWRQLLADVFPGLRHSDYEVRYTIRPFTVEEAREIIRTKPQQLSLNEMFLVANTYAAGSQAYDNVFETAVRVYPDDPTANLNAAIIALNKNDLAAAEQYLTKAGDSAEAHNARGVLAAKQGDNEAAEAAFRQAAPLSEAEHNLGELQRVAAQ